MNDPHGSWEAAPAFPDCDLFYTGALPELAIQKGLTTTRGAGPKIQTETLLATRLTPPVRPSQNPIRADRPVPSVQPITSF
jgi:hypothetical protein